MSASTQVRIPPAETEIVDIPETQLKVSRVGAAMAANLVKAGHDVSVLNRSPEGGEHLDWSAIGGLATQDAGDHQVTATSLMSSAV
jgi:hypothetical protein